MKHLLKLGGMTPEEILHILDVADQLKAQQKLGGTAPLLAGKTVALMFSKASTRTRTSFEVGVYQLGGLITGEIGFNFFTIVAVAIIAFTIYLLFRPNKYEGVNEVSFDSKKAVASK